MKTIFLAIIASFALFVAKAQTQTAVWKLSPNNLGALYCPNTETNYNAYIQGLPAQTNCEYIWRIEGGYFPLHSNGTSASVKYDPNIRVVWNNQATGKLYLTVKDCQTATSNAAESPFSFYLKTVSTETPTTNLTLPIQVQKSINEATLTANRVQVPNTGSNGDVSGVTTSIYADEYEWTLPSDRPTWYFRGTTQSNRTFRTSSPTVVVVVDALSSGAVTVRGVISSCVPNNFSKALSLPITRTTPNIGAIATAPKVNTISSDGKIECGVADTITLSTTLPQGLTARNYKWRFSAAQSGWKFVRNGVLQDTAVTTTNTVRVLSVANTTPSFGVRANINYGNNIFEDSNESILAIKLNSVTPTLNISAKKTEMCATETDGIPVALLASGGIITSYELVPLDKNAQGLVTVERDLSAPNKFIISPVKNADGIATISFRVSNSCGLSSISSIDIRIVPSAPTAIGRLYTNEREPFCLNSDKLFWIDPVPYATSYVWRAIDKDMIVDGIGTRGYIFLSSYNSKRFSITAFNACDSVRKIFYVAAPRPSPNDPPCMRTNANGETLDLNAVNIYPNPANSVLNIELPVMYSEDLELRLYDNVGQIRKTITLNQATVTDNTIQISVQDLPIGLYVLQLADLDFTKQYQVMITR
jgi:hypothetical protein